MRTFITAVIFYFTALLVSAQNSQTHNNTSIAVSDTSDKSNLSQLLSSYYHIKDALASDDAATAAAKAGDFVKIANSIDHKVISENNINSLKKDAVSIAENTDLEKQREYFENLSANMITLAKTLKLSSEPVYQQYCPMKKASWLSSEKIIRNPYYGSAMLTCGEVVNTINQ